MRFRMRGLMMFWGSVRSGSPSGYPNTRYCANLGHKQDDESGLIYMRARYFEPWTGRFVTEDPARDGWNWFVYGGNCPSMKVDATGKQDLWEFLGATLIYLGLCFIHRGFVEILNGASGVRGAWVNALIGASTLSGPFEVDVIRTLFFAAKALTEGILSSYAILGGIAQLYTGANLIYIGYYISFFGDDGSVEARRMLEDIGDDLRPQFHKE